MGRLEVTLVAFLWSFPLSAFSIAIASIDISFILAYFKVDLLFFLIKTSFYLIPCRSPLQHLCRACGFYFCSDCTPWRHPIPKFGYFSEQRVCSFCYVAILGPSLLSLPRHLLHLHLPALLTPL